MTINAKSIESLKALYELENLDYLLIVDTQVTDAELEAFQETRPDVQLSIAP